MKQRSLCSSYEIIMTLRCLIEEAYAQGDLPAALVLSRKMDGIQLLHWETPLPQVS